MIEYVIDKLSALIEPAAAFSKERRELRDNALRAISHALNETYLYYRGMELGKPRDHDTEAQLAKYWSAAAIPLRHIDGELAMLCDQKSEYWINPDNWDQNKIKEIGIGLDSVRARYRKLLYPGLNRIGKSRGDKDA